MQSSSGELPTLALREVPVVLFLKGIGLACLSHRAAADRRRGEVESAVRLAPVIIVGEIVAADVPDALTRRNRNLSPSARHS